MQLVDRLSGVHTVIGAARAAQHLPCLRPCIQPVIILAARERAQLEQKRIYPEGQLRMRQVPVAASQLIRGSKRPMYFDFEGLTL